MIVYRVITDEPIGVCVGFPPPPDYESDQFQLVSDDGGDKVFIIDNKVIITSAPQVNGQYPEPDLEIWRSPDEFDRWTKGMNGLGEDAVKTLTVTEETEIILDGEKYLLENGDKIMVEVRSPGYSEMRDAAIDAAMLKLAASDKNARSEVNFDEVMAMAKKFGGMEKSPDPKVLAFTFSRFSDGRDAFEQWLDTKGIPHRDWGNATSISLYDIPTESKINEAKSYNKATTEDGEEITCSFCGKPIFLATRWAQHGGEEASTTGFDRVHGGVEIAIAPIWKKPHDFDPQVDEYYHVQCAKHAMAGILDKVM